MRCYFPIQCLSNLSIIEFVAGNNDSWMKNVMIFGNDCFIFNVYTDYSAYKQKFIYHINCTKCMYVI